MDEQAYRAYLDGLVGSARAIDKHGTQALAAKHELRCERVRNLRLATHQQFLWANRTPAFVWEDREGGPEGLPYDELVWIATEPYRALALCTDVVEGRAWVGVRQTESAVRWTALKIETWQPDSEESSVRAMITELSNQETFRVRP